MGCWAAGLGCRGCLPLWPISSSALYLGDGIWPFWGQGVTAFAPCKPGTLPSIPTRKSLAPRLDLPVSWDWIVSSATQGRKGVGGGCLGGSVHLSSPPGLLLRSLKLPSLLRFPRPVSQLFRPLHGGLKDGPKCVHIQMCGTCKCLFGKGPFRQV